jgi:chemotaxis protein MotB
MRKAVIAVMIAALCLLCLAGCGEKSSSGLSPVQTANVPSLQQGSIEVPSYNHPEISAATVAPIDPITIEITPYDPPEITAVTVAPIDPITIEITPYEFPEIKPVTVAPIESITITVPEYQHKPIEASGVTINVPEIDYEISSDRIGSAYSDTYTVPDIQVEVPEFDAPELSGVYVGVADNLSPEDQEKLAGMSDAEFAEIAAVQLSLTDKLTEAFRSAGVTLAIDPITGAIPITAGLLYETDKYELRPEGKEALRAVFLIYFSVICQPEFQGAVDSIIIEGHTDTEGDHAYNQELSEKRAQAVCEYLLSDECGMPNREYLRSLLKTVGRSYDDPVYAADGTVNMDASRRVEIRFALNLEPNS